MLDGYIKMDLLGNNLLKLYNAMSHATKLSQVIKSNYHKFLKCFCCDLFFCEFKVERVSEAIWRRE